MQQQKQQQQQTKTIMALSSLSAFQCAKTCRFGNHPFVTKGNATSTAPTTPLAGVGSSL